MFPRRYQFDLSGDVAVVANQTIAFEDRIYTYTRSTNGTWSQDASKTIALDSFEDGNIYDAQIQLEGDMLFVGMQDGMSNAGKVQTYELGASAWELRSELFSSVSGSTEFGERLAYDEGWLAVAAGDGKDRVELFQTFDMVNWAHSITINADEWTDDHFFPKFGEDLSFENGFLAIGSPLDDQVVTDGGAVHVYRLDNSNRWQFETKLTAPDVAADDNLHNVVLNGDYILVGSDDSGISVENEIRDDAGAIYAFRVQNQPPTANPDTATTDEDTGLSIDVLANDTHPDAGDDPSAFSLDSVDSVSVSGLSIDPMLPAGVISIEANEILFTPGATFEELEDGESAIVTVNYSMSDEAGATSQSTLTLTVTGVDAPTSSLNAEFIETLLPTSVSSGEDMYGFSVAASDDYVVIGAPGDDTISEDAGSVYFYDFDSLELVVKVDYPGNTSSAKFGTSVAIDGDTVVVGAPDDNLDGSDGGVYVFDMTSGSPVMTGSFSSGVGPNSKFGLSVSVSGDLIAVGETRVNSFAGGFVHVFDYSGGTAHQHRNVGCTDCIRWFWLRCRN